MLVAVSATACVQPSPASLVANARRAHARALEAEAERYSPDSLALASRALDDALSEVETQSQRTFFLRDYTLARSRLGQAVQLARGARYEAQARRDQLRSEAAMILERARHDLMKLENDVPASAEVGASAWTAWIRRYREASDALTEARVAFEDGDYFGAHAHGARVLERIHDAEDASPSS